jgi:hypothetical protein
MGILCWSEFLLSKHYIVSRPDPGGGFTIRQVANRFAAAALARRGWRVEGPASAGAGERALQRLSAEAGRAVRR